MALSPPAGGTSRRPASRARAHVAASEGATRGRLVAVLVGLLVATGACAPTEAEGPDGSVVFAQVLAQAEASTSASDAQISALREGAETGRISLEVVREAARRAVACLAELGLDAEYDERSLAYGLVVPGYVVRHAPGADVDRDVATCDEREFGWVNELYQVQPSSVEASERYLEQQAPVIRACLDRNDVRTGRDPSGPDLARAASEALQASDGRIDCLAEAGVDAW